MRIVIFLIVGTAVLTACDETRHYEENIDFENRYWLAADKPVLEFEIVDTTQPYSLYLNVRNESTYPNSNLYFMYYLLDENGVELEKKLKSEFLFDKKTGQPLGSSGLGYIYNHRFLLLDNYSFQKTGKYNLRYEQFMRTDTLRGILSVGLRIEKTKPGR